MAVQGLDKLLSQLANLEDLDTGKAILAGAYKLQAYSQDSVHVVTGFLKGSAESEEVSKTEAQMRFMADYAYYEEMRHPYVRPNIDAHERDIIEAVADELKKQIGEAK